MNVVWPNDQWLVLISSTTMYSTIIWLLFQQEQVLGELYNYVSQQPPPTDVQHVKLTLKYLEACNKIFENGLLSHDRVTITNRDILISIRKGYDFFCNWHRSLVEAGKNYIHLQEN